MNWIGGGRRQLIKSKKMQEESQLIQYYEKVRILN